MSVGAIKARESKDYDAYDLLCINTISKIECKKHKMYHRFHFCVMETVILLCILSGGYPSRGAGGGASPCEYEN